MPGIDINYVKNLLFTLVKQDVLALAGTSQLQDRGACCARNYWLGPGFRRDDEESAGDDGESAGMTKETLAF